MNILISLLLLGFGTLFVVKTNAVVGVVGRFGWAERNLGGGGTFSFYKLLGIAMIIIGFMLITGLFERMFGSTFGFLFGGIRQN